MRDFSGGQPDARLDKVGAILSLACGVHCLLEPFVLPLLPLAGIALPVNRTAELAMIGISVCLAIWNFSRGTVFKSATASK